MIAMVDDFEAPCWRKKNCLHFVENEEKEAPTPTPETILVLFGLKSCGFSNDSCPLVGFFLDPPRSLSSSMEDRTYGILELLSLQGQQNLQADLI